MTGLRSLQSLGLVAMIGLAPTARVALAESLMTTLLVIYALVSLRSHDAAHGDLPDAQAVSRA